MNLKSYIFVYKSVHLFILFILGEEIESGNGSWLIKNKKTIIVMRVGM